MITQVVVYWIFFFFFFFKKKKKKKKKKQIIAAHLGKQKTLDADSRAIQQIAFNGKANAGVMTYYILEQ